VSMSMTFRYLSPKEESEFRAWARAHNSPEYLVKGDVYHPVVRDEWNKLGLWPHKPNKLFITDPAAATAEAVAKVPVTSTEAIKPTPLKHAVELVYRMHKALGSAFIVELFDFYDGDANGVLYDELGRVATQVRRMPG